MGCQSAFAIVEHDGAGGRLECTRTALDLVRDRVDFEAVQSRNKLFHRLLWPIIGMNHEEHVGEARTEIRAVTMMVPRALWIVDIHALRTVQFYHCFTGNVA